MMSIGHQSGLKLYDALNYLLERQIVSEKKHVIFFMILTSSVIHYSFQYFAEYQKSWYWSIVSIVSYFFNIADFKNLRNIYNLKLLWKNAVYTTFFINNQNLNNLPENL